MDLGLWSTRALVYVAGFIWGVYTAPLGLASQLHAVPKRELEVERAMRLRAAAQRGKRNYYLQIYIETPVLKYISGVEMAAPIPSIRFRKAY